MSANGHHPHREQHSLGVAWGRIALIGAVFVLTSRPALAQCPGEWVATDGASGAAPNVGGLVTWDPDGAGPQSPLLAVGGGFESAGGVPASNIATWDGTTWSALSTGTNGDINALAVLPGGELVAAGAFTSAGEVGANRIARWDGQAWHPLGGGLNGEVFCLTVMPNGELIAGGNFSMADGLPAAYIARWNGTNWSPIGTGLGGIVYSMTVMTNGDLVAGGNFLMAGSTTVRYIARWTGTVWQGIGGGMNAAVLAVAAMPNGDLIASGIFSQRIGRFDGTQWNTLGTGLNAQALVILPQSDTEFIAGGHFVAAGGLSANKIARWDGAAWHALGSGLDQYVIALALTPKGDLAVGGGFTMAGGLPSPYLALWTIPGAPVVTQQPMSATTCSWSDANFTMSATGDTPLNWQWQAQLDPGVWTDLFDGELVHNDIVLGAVSGSHSDTLHFSSLGHFREDRMALGLRCTVFNVCGLATTDVATLGVRAACIGDTNCDGLVTLDDLSMLLAHFGMQGGSPSVGDFDGDSDVDLADLSNLLAQFGVICP